MRFKRLTVEEVSEFFETHGCKLLSEEYTNNKQRLEYQCECGTISQTSFANFRRGHRCQNCRKRKISGEGHWHWNPNREEVELNKSIMRKCYSALYNTLKATGKRKDTKAFNMLGYTTRELKEHIEKHPDWENVKQGKWHLDHKFPIKSFCDYGITDISLINCLENLQPMTGRENLKKKDSYDRAEFEKWLKRKR